MAAHTLFEDLLGHVETNNGVMQPLLTDKYQFSMAYAYWKAGKAEDAAVFELFFRKNPFDGEFTIFAGLGECLRLLKHFQFSKSDIEYLEGVFPTAEPEFWDYMRQLTPKNIRLYAVDEGNVVFPRVPLMRIEGPLAIAQLLETALLNLVNYASLVATNAARHRLAAGNEIKLVEMGLRRAQGPDGGLSASRCSYLGGFDGTSNTLAGKLFHIPLFGTHAHSFVSSFGGTGDVKSTAMHHKQGGGIENFMALSLKWRAEVVGYLGLPEDECSDGELAAFASYALAFPDSFTALVDTYDTLRSGIPNFCAVTLALNDLGYRAKGIRLDSGDLAYLSTVTRSIFERISERYQLDWFTHLMIMASNEINEDVIISLRNQGHRIDCFGVGTNLVTCQRQPALGCVYKLVEVNGEPRMKLSESIEKVTLPGRKGVYRLYGATGEALVDLMMTPEEIAPAVGVKVLCRHPFQESKRAWVDPGMVEPLLKLYWEKGRVCQELPSLEKMRERAGNAMASLRADHKRTLNPTPYKVSVSNKLYHFVHEFWLKNAPIGQLQ